MVRDLSLKHEVLCSLILGTTYNYSKPSGAFTLTGNFTFVYPTVYMAHRFITVSAGGVWLWNKEPEDFPHSSQVRSPGVVALDPNDVYTLQPQKLHYVGTDYASLVARGAFTHEPREELVDGSTWFPKPRSVILPLKYSDLQDPVPASLYYDAQANFCWGSNSQQPCATITDGSYRPQLAFKRKVWQSILTSLDDWGCAMPTVVDPPIALRPVNSLNDLVLPSFAYIQPSHTTDTMATIATAQTRMAQPGTGLGQPFPAPTSPPTSYEYSWNSPDRGTPFLHSILDENVQPQRPTRTIMIGSKMVSVVRGGPTFEDEFYIGSRTLRRGQAVTIDGHVISITNNAMLVDNSVALEFGRTTFRAEGDGLRPPRKDSTVGTSDPSYVESREGQRGENYERPETALTQDKFSGQGASNAEDGSFGTSNGAVAADSSETSSSTELVSASHKTRSRSSAKLSIDISLTKVVIAVLLLGLLLN
jgi:hypothetical protein